MQNIFETIANKLFGYFWFEAMHTRIDLLLRGETEEELIEVAKLIQSQLMNFEKIVNRFNPKSELSILNETAFRDCVEVSEELFPILKMAIEAYSSTCGYFDPTINSTTALSSRDRIAAVRLGKSSVQFEADGILLDLNGLVKGVILDEVIRLIRERGIEDAFINLGNSSIGVLGNQPGSAEASGWCIEIPNSIRDNREVNLVNSFFTTSGNLSQTHTHIINPLTGVFVRGKKEISVVTPTSSMGEVLSTALFAASPDEYERILANFPSSYIC